MTATERRQHRRPVRVDFYISGSAHCCPALLKAGNSAFGLFVRCGMESLRTDRPGFITEENAQADADWSTRAERLVAAGLWKTVENGWEMIPVPVPIEPLFKFVPVYRRDPIPAHLRKQVFARDHHRCVECGATGDLTLDHIRPWSLGGPDTYENLRVLCRSCNSKKGAKV